MRFWGLMMPLFAFATRIEPTSWKRYSTKERHTSYFPNNAILKHWNCTGKQTTFFHKRVFIYSWAKYKKHFTNLNWLSKCTRKQSTLPRKERATYLPITKK